MTTVETIMLSEIAGEIEDETVAEVESLSPSNCDPLVIVERMPSGTVNIVDGFHRTAGMVKWARGRDRELDAIKVQVVVCDDAGLLRDAGEPGPKQGGAIEAIYAMVAE